MPSDTTHPHPHHDTSRLNTPSSHRTPCPRKTPTTHATTKRGITDMATPPPPPQQQPQAHLCLELTQAVLSGLGTGLRWWCLDAQRVEPGGGLLGYEGEGHDSTRATPHAFPPSHGGVPGRVNNDKGSHPIRVRQGGGGVIGQRMATLGVPWLIRQRVQRRWAGESTGGGGCTDVGLV